MTRRDRTQSHHRGGKTGGRRAERSRRYLTPVLRHVLLAAVAIAFVVPFYWIAISALKDFQLFLEKELPAKATRPWRLGPALYKKKFPLALQTSKTPEQVMPIARAAFEKTRIELYASARKLHAQYVVLASFHSVLKPCSR